MRFPLVITEPRLKRAYRDRPAKIVKESHCELKFSANTEVIENKIAMFGWRVYVSNHPETGLSLADAVVAYRDEYLMERGFGRLKGFPLSLTPIYLQREDHYLWIDPFALDRFACLNLTGISSASPFSQQEEEAIGALCR